MASSLISVVIPAHNEETVILPTLDALLADALPAEFEVIVVCNGCTDQTAALVQKNSEQVIVLEQMRASKTEALNAGIARARGHEVLLLDADVVLTTNAARQLACAVRSLDIDAAIGHMKLDTTGASWLVQAFYRVWLEHPYVVNGKFAAAFALSRKALDRIGPLPAVIADDTYLRRVIAKKQVKSIPQVNFLVRAPRTLHALILIRARSYRGTRQLNVHTPLGRRERTKEARGLIRRLFTRPQLWPYIPVYLFVTLVSRVLALTTSTETWERDLTTRENLAKTDN